MNDISVEVWEERLASFKKEERGGEKSEFHKYFGETISLEDKVRYCEYMLVRIKENKEPGFKFS